MALVVLVVAAALVVPDRWLARSRSDVAVGGDGSTAAVCQSGLACGGAPVAVECQSGHACGGAGRGLAAAGYERRVPERDRLRRLIRDLAAAGYGSHVH